MMDGVVKRDIINYRRQKAHDLMHDVDILMEFYSQQNVLRMFSYYLSIIDYA